MFRYTASCCFDYR